MTISFTPCVPASLIQDADAEPMKVPKGEWWHYLTRGVRTGDPFAELLYPEMLADHPWCRKKSSDIAKREFWLDMKYSGYDWDMMIWNHPEGTLHGEVNGMAVVSTDYAIAAESRVTPPTGNGLYVEMGEPWRTATVRYAWSDRIMKMSKPWEKPVQVYR